MPPKRTTKKPSSKTEHAQTPAPVADKGFKLVVDVREAVLYDKINEYFLSLGFTYPIELKPLDLGDIIIMQGDLEVALFERKCMTDLISSIKDGRYEEQSHRLCGTTKMQRHQCVYLIEGTFTQLRNQKVERKIVNSAITSLLFFKGFSVIRTFSINETAEYLAMCIDKLSREYLKKGKTIYQPDAKNEAQPEISLDTPKPNLENNATTANTAPPENVPAAYCTVVKKVKKENVTPENIGEIILCQIPGISSTNAIQIMREFGSLEKLVESAKNEPQKLREMQIKNEKTGKCRKINCNIVENIIKYLAGNPGSPATPFLPE